MIDHGIHISGRYKETKARFTKSLNAFFMTPVRLWDDSHTVSTTLKETADNGRTERRMIYIGISCDIYKIDLIPSALLHFLLCYG